MQASSNDGSIVVSTILDENGFPQATYWDSNGNVHLLPELPSTNQRTIAKGVSADGSIIVGEDRDSQFGQSIRTAQKDGFWDYQAF